MREACEQTAKGEETGGRGPPWSPGQGMNLWGRRPGAGAGAGLVGREEGGLRRGEQWVPLTGHFRRRITNG